LVARYNSECIYQMLEEYPEITGVGFFDGERTENLDYIGKTDWMSSVYFPALKNVSRPVNLIYRSSMSTDPNVAIIIRKAITDAKLKGKVFVQLKFNWSHGHSTQILVQIHGGGDGKLYYDPAPTDYQITWTVRNEDFFFFRWGLPQFARTHIAVNGHSWVAGYTLGSEGYIPAVDYSHVKPSPHVTWDYAFEKQWLFYMVWGRLLYDPDTPNNVFENEFNQRYPGLGLGSELLEAYTLISDVPHKIASFYFNTWDFALHSEGFIAAAENPDTDSKGFISVLSLLKQKVLDPTLQSVADFVAAPNSSLKNPLLLADELQQEAEQALAIVQKFPTTVPPTLECEILDILSWAHLGIYFSYKLRGAVALQTFIKKNIPIEKIFSISYLTEAQTEWKTLVDLTDDHLLPQIPLLDIQPTKWSWANWEPQIIRDIDIAKNATFMGN